MNKIGNLIFAVIILILGLVLGCFEPFGIPGLLLVIAAFVIIF